MASIPKTKASEKSAINTVVNFFSQYRLNSALRKAGACKQKGVSVSTIFMYLVSLVYVGKSMYEDMRSANPLADGFSKDTVYRFLNSMAVNWQAFLLIIAGNVIAEFDKLTADNRLTAFVIDDTMFQVPYAKKAELVSLVHDHAEKGKSKFKCGFRMLTLCWTDGVSLIPLAFRHLASADEKKRRTGVASKVDRRSRAYRIRKEAMMKATDVLLLQLKASLKARIRAKHVLFDAWFSFPVTIRKVCALGLHVTARVKNTSKIYYLVNGEKKTAAQIYKENRKRRGRSRYLLSVPIVLPATDDSGEDALPASLIYVRNRQKRKDWIALITTDLALTEDEIIALYGKRWQIEVFFKVCKSYLKLTGEFQQLSYDALVAHTSIVMVRYIILSAEKRKHDDPRSLGALFFYCFDEVPDIRFEQALLLVLSLLVDALKDVDLGLSEDLIDQLLDTFINSLPPQMRSYLVPDRVAQSA